MLDIVIKNQSNSVAIGTYAGQTSQQESSVAIGYQAGFTGQGESSVAIGEMAGQTKQGESSVAIGEMAGQTKQGTNSVAIGDMAGQYNQCNCSVAIGSQAGYTGQGLSSIAIGDMAGQYNQGSNSVAIGYQAGFTGQGGYSVAIGENAGKSKQTYGSVAIGRNAGQTGQGAFSVAIGDWAGETSQRDLSVAIGSDAGQTSQHKSSVAIGGGAGQINQGESSVAIGYHAGQSNQPANSIVICANLDGLNATDSGFYVKPVRAIYGTGSVIVGPNRLYTLMFDKALNEILYWDYAINPVQLKYCTKGNEVTKPIFLGRVTFVDNTTQGVGSLTFSNGLPGNGLTTGQQITIRTYGQIDSPATSNVITYFLLDEGVRFNSHILGSTNWQPFDSVVFETRITMLSPSNPLIQSFYSKNGGQMFNYLSTDGFNPIPLQTTVPVRLQIAFQSTSACNFKHYYTEILSTA